MDHNEAIRLMGTERYLLNELSPELREQFEEHFFACPECANDVRTGALFLEYSKAIFAAEAAAPQRAIGRAENRGWSTWLRPAFVVPAFVALLAVIVFQSLPSRHNPQVLQAAYVNIGSRGGSLPSVTAKPGTGFLLRVTVPPDQGYASYVVDILAPNGKKRWSLPLPAATGEDGYFIQVPAGSYDEGVYSLAVRGTNPDGSSSAELGRGSFELHVLK